MFFMSVGRCVPGSREGTMALRPRRLVSSSSYRPRSFVIQAKKGSALVPPPDPRRLKRSKSSRMQYLEEDPGASGILGKPIPAEEPAVIKSPQRVEAVAVPTAPSPMTYLREDPVRGLTFISAAVLGIWIAGMVVVRVVKGGKKREPIIQVSKMNALLKEKEDKMTTEFERLLSEQLEQKEDEHRQQLIEQTAKQESEFDGRLASREREVRRILESEFKIQIETESSTIKTEMKKQKEELEDEKKAAEEKLKQQFENDKAQIEMEWMKKLEVKDKEQAKGEEAALKAERLVKELKQSHDHMKQHEGLMEDQLKEYETMMHTLKETHRLDLERMMNGHRDEIRELKEEIRGWKALFNGSDIDSNQLSSGLSTTSPYTNNLSKHASPPTISLSNFQEIEIDKRKQAKEEEEEKQRLATATIPDHVQENGHVHPETETQSVAVQTKSEPVVETPEMLPLHQNGRLEEAVQEAEIRLVLAGTIVPHADKVMRGGEDAFFVSGVDYGAMGVADGVGSWSADGIDPSAYAKELMTAAEAYLATTTDRPLNLMHCLEHAHEVSKSPGSATMCVAIVQPDGVLEVANVGDCGVRVFRGSKCVFATETMQHEFNMPYQLGHPLMLAETDWPSDAELYSFELKEGDVVVMGSDGLFDNVWDDDLARVVNSFVGSRETDQSTAETISKRIADVAHFNAKQEKIQSPWAVQAAQAGAVSFMKRLFPEGGKMDDCTVVVGFAHRFS